MLRFAFALSILAVPALFGQSGFEYWPGVKYDPAIPTAQKVLGRAIGDRVSWHHEIVKYMEALAAAAPNRMKIFDHGKTWEGRRLIHAAVGSEANIRRLPEIRDAMKRLADPRRTPEAEAQKLMAGLPAVVWLGYGVHGNEISSPDAALQTAYHLLAARGDKMTENILANVLVLIDPLQNPDGRDRFVHNYEIAEGLEPDASPAAAEHSEPWPGGRTNHYYFDMNRDWFAITQPETRGRVKALLDWYPQVFVDLHEMGTDSSYYFAPDAIPFNPHLTTEQKNNQVWFGKNNAKYFDQFGYSYFTREVYDAFYPGYGASWPSYYGSIAMTYENGSTRGLLVRKSDESIIHFRETVRRHFITSVATCETAAMNKGELLREFYRYRKTAIEEGSKEKVREYILARRGDVSAVDKLAQLLVEQGVDVKRSLAPFTSGGKQYPAGSYVVSMAQPAKRLARTLLDPDVSMGEAFLKDEERRRKRRLPSEIYDVTAWSVPLQMGVECVAAETPSAGEFAPVKLGDTPSGKVSGKASVAYIAPWGTAASGRLLATALRNNYKILSNDRPFTLNGRTYGLGALIFKVKDNPASLHESIGRMAASSGAEVQAIDTSWTEDGPTFGSRHINYLRKPVVAMAWDQPAGTGSAGHTRFVLERQYGYPITVIRTAQLAGADLDRFDVIILPDGGFGGGYAGVLGANGSRRLRDWVQGGGTVIGVGAAPPYLAGAGLLGVSQENAARPGEPAQGGRSGAAGPSGGGTGSQPGTQAAGQPGLPAQPSRVPGRIFAKEEEFDRFVQPDTELPENLHGVLARAKVDGEHWLGSGLPEFVNVLVSGRSIYQPLKADRGTNVAVFAAADKVLASGYIWEEYRKQIAFKAFLVLERQGRGNVIGFTADPNYRAYMDGLNLMFLNAVFRGPAHAGRGAAAAEEFEQR